jgi:hypothetical protein
LLFASVFPFFSHLIWHYFRHLLHMVSKWDERWYLELFTTNIKLICRCNFCHTRGTNPLHVSGIHLKTYLNFRLLNHTVNQSLLCLLLHVDQ